jgi:hypothetical protein
LGYDVTSVAAGSIDPAQWPLYDAVVWSSGRNQSPVASSSYRTALQDWVNGGGRLLIEGGEIGYDACSSPSYPTFAAQVIHCTHWYQDSSGDLKRNLSAHPLMTTPNSIPATAAHDYGGDYGTEDGLAVASDAQSPMTWTTGTGASMVAYDTDGAPENGGSIVFFAFEVAGVTDATTRDAMIENAVSWVLGRTSTAVDDATALPAAFELHGPMPNPCTSSARLTLALPAPGAVSVGVYDAAGRRVARPFGGALSAGVHAIRLDRASAAALPGGVYWVRVRWDAAGAREDRTVRLVLLK